jgi:hypothetical protein
MNIATLAPAIEHLKLTHILPTHFATYNTSTHSWWVVQDDAVAFAAARLRDDPGYQVDFGSWLSHYGTEVKEGWWSPKQTSVWRVFYANDGSGIAKTPDLVKTPARPIVGHGMHVERATVSMFSGKELSQPLQRAVDVLGAIEVAPERYAYKNDGEEHYFVDTAKDLTPFGQAIIDHGDPKTWDGDLGTATYPAHMPKWWSPGQQDAYRLALHYALHTETLYFNDEDAALRVRKDRGGGVLEHVTVDVDTGDVILVPTPASVEHFHGRATCVACAQDAIATMTPGERAVHDVLVKYAPDWDEDQRAAIALDLSDAALRFTPITSEMYYLLVHCDATVEQLQEAYDAGVAGFFQRVGEADSNLWELARTTGDDTEAIDVRIDDFTPAVAQDALVNEFAGCGLTVAVQRGPYFSPTTPELREQFVREPAALKGM